ncbi:uncharacterized protein N0V89_010995 [Didymosphaeria variabile]|uniref:Uncharacterized protein n=1 Tax=Didymosphaeria variabile TaxID=1932322 RepID=A0A9W9C608_9PLEO|nr:uncharacterized protein N0V89_010995 [Didymosphaeria variabile]KAJ4347060.1 hypothetical protein N0V89_010995 [Didymosphaeria variabile]
MLAICVDKAGEEDAPLELGARTSEELTVVNKDVPEELTLEPSELVVLDVKLADEVVLTNPGGGDGISTGTAVVIVADAELKGTVEVRVKVTVVEDELAPATDVEDVIGEDDRLLEIVRVNVGEVAVDTTRDEVTTEGTAGRLGAASELVEGRVVAKDDASSEPETGELLEVSSTEVVDVNCVDSVPLVAPEEGTTGADVGIPGGPDPTEDGLEGRPEDTGTLPEITYEGRIGAPPEENPGSGLVMLADDTGGDVDAVAEPVVGTLGCTLVGSDGDVIGVDASGVLPDSPGKPELCSVFVTAPVGEMPDDRPEVCVSGVAPLEIDDGLPFVR